MAARAVGQKTCNLCSPHLVHHQRLGSGRIGHEEARQGTQIDRYPRRRACRAVLNSSRTTSMPLLVPSRASLWSSMARSQLLDGDEAARHTAGVIRIVGRCRVGGHGRCLCGLLPRPAAAASAFIAGRRKPPERTPPNVSKAIQVRLRRVDSSSERRCQRWLRMSDFFLSCSCHFVAVIGRQPARAVGKQ